jgi:hypothetical protein
MYTKRVGWIFILDSLENSGGGDASERRDFKRLSGKIGADGDTMDGDVGWERWCESVYRIACCVEKCNVMVVLMANLSS